MIRGCQRDEPTIQLTGLVQSIECSDLEIPNTITPGGNYHRDTHTIKTLTILRLCFSSIQDTKKQAFRSPNLQAGA